MLRAVGHPVAVNPDAELARVARAEGWRIMRFDKLGRRLKLGAAVGALALMGGGGGYLAARARPRRRRLRCASALATASRASSSVRKNRQPITLPSRRACATCQAICSTDVPLPAPVP